MSIDVARVAGLVNEFWDAYGYILIVGAGLAALALVVLALVKVARSRQRDRWVSGLAAVVVLAWTSEGLWEVARHTLDLPAPFAAMTFFVFESMMLSAALQAEQHRRRHGAPGPAGRYVWVLATLTATVVALNAATLVEAVLRFVLPLAVAGLWWVGITAERDSDNQPGPDGRTVREKREEAARQHAATWAVTPRTLLVRMRIMRPGAQTVTDAEREYRVRRMVVYADRAHSAHPKGLLRRYAAYRLRRLARLATTEDVAAVRDRMARATSILALVTSATRPGSEAGPAPSLRPGDGDAVPGQVGEHPGSHPGDRVNGERPPAGHRAGSYPGTTRALARTSNRATQVARSERAPGRAAGRTRAAPHRQDAERAWRMSLASGAPLSGGQLAARFGVDESTARRWIRDWRTRPDANGDQDQGQAEADPQ